MIITSPAIAISEDQCRVMKEVAEGIMDARQAGIDILDVTDAMDSVKTKKGVDYLVKSMIKSAYLEPVYNVPKLKEQVIKDFGVSYYLACSSI